MSAVPGKRNCQRHPDGTWQGRGGAAVEQSRLVERSPGFEFTETAETRVGGQIAGGQIFCLIDGKENEE